MIFLALTLCLAGVGVGYGHWSKELTIDATVNTGAVDWEFTGCSVLDQSAPPNPEPDYTCRDGFAGPAPLFWQGDKNVGWGGCLLVDADGDLQYDTCELTFHNVYPCYYNAVSVYTHAKGTVPIIFEKLVINGKEITSEPTPVVRLDLNGDGLDDVEIWWLNGLGQQRHPCEHFTEMSFWFHVLQDAPQGATLSFTIELVAVQYNASIH